MNAEAFRLQAQFPTPSKCTRIFVGAILASQSNQDVQGREVGCNLFAERAVSASGSETGAGPYAVHQGDYG
jgi:hypothetical protein